MKFHIDFDLEKPDEERALLILDDWQRRSGLPPQKIIIMALLALGAAPTHAVSSPDLEELDELRDLMLDVQDQSAATLNEVRQLMDRVQDLLEQGIPTHQHQQPVEAEPPREKLPDAMIASLKKGVKPGFTLED